MCEIHAPFPFADDGSRAAEAGRENQRAKDLTANVRGHDNENVRLAEIFTEFCRHCGTSQMIAGG